MFFLYCAYLSSSEGGNVRIVGVVCYIPTTLVSSLDFLVISYIDFLSDFLSGFLSRSPSLLIYCLIPLVLIFHYLVIILITSLGHITPHLSHLVDNRGFRFHKSPPAWCVSLVPIPCQLLPVEKEIIRRPEIV